MREFDSFKTVMAVDAAELRASDLPKVRGQQQHPRVLTRV